MVRQNDQLKLGYSICSTVKLLSKKISFNWSLKEIQKQEVFTLKITELLTFNFVLLCFDWNWSVWTQDYYFD